MPITLQRFTAERLDAADLETMMAAIEAKFNAAITTADFKWPLDISGDIDMNGNTLLNVPRFWGAASLLDRFNHASAQSVFDEIASKGGGIVKLPGGSTQPSSEGGLKVGSNTVVSGDGHSSIFSGDIVLDGVDNVTIEHCKLAELTITNSTNITLNNVWLRGAGATVGVITATGVDGFRLVACDIDGHATFDGVENLRYDQCNFGHDTTNVLVDVSGNVIRDLQFDGCHFVRTGTAGPAVRVLPDDTATDVHFNGCQFDGNYVNCEFTRTRGIYFDGCIMDEGLAKANLAFWSGCRDISFSSTILVSAKECIVVGCTEGFTDITNNTLDNFAEIANINISDSNFDATGDAIVVAVKNSGLKYGPFLSINGNLVEADKNGVVLLDLDADPTPLAIDAQIIANMYEKGASGVGLWCNTTHNTSARGGDIGTYSFDTLETRPNDTAMGSWFILHDNDIEGFLEGPGTGNDASDDSGARSLVTSNNP